ncbi:polysaccharide pyruvyl transferase family protein [Acinetobacter sp.]|uniref:polysaccharide pyruvyl transferase family protein n=1 Tax=Acinetobacter sp. TaxID=472 RepID=UPI003C74881C
MKKIGILTLGLKDNYGGILQAIALYFFLKQNGYQPVLIRKYPIENSIKGIIRKILEIIPFQNIRGIRISNIKYHQNLIFWSQYIDCQTPIFTHKKQIENYISKNDLSAIVVGSDQVWRYTYINDSEYDTYFLNFRLEKEIKKISYAASFGINTWEHTDSSTEITSFLKKFNFISVREKSGIEICYKNFNITNVAQVLDPTLLVGSSFFKSMIEDKKSEIYDCITYVLDKNHQKQNIINFINKKYNNKNNKDLLTDSSMLSIPEWVGSFNTSKMIITDSFHGMVFAILFEKDFFVIVNKDRGSDRFISLCEKLDILDRLIDNEMVDINFMSIKPLNYDKINKNLADLRKISSDFLLNALQDE